MIQFFLFLKPEVSQAYVGEEILLPTDIEFVLEPDKKDFFLGENALVHFCLENNGSGVIKFNIGGDYRGTLARHNRFKIVVKDEAGNIQPDPDPLGVHMGGLGGTYELKPSENWCISLPLVRYASIDKEGTYTVEVKHGFGWTLQEGQTLPVAKTKIRMRMPSPEQAQAIVDETFNLPDRTHYVSWGDWGKKSPPGADFRSLRYPLYLPLIKDRALRGNKNAIQAIGEIPTLEATKVLIELLNGDDPELLSQVTGLLNRRLPNSLELGMENLDKLDEETRDKTVRYFRSYQEFFDKTWSDELEVDIRKSIKKFLQSDNDQIVSLSSFLIKSLGTKEDIPDLITAINIAISKVPNIPREEMVYPPRRGALSSLIQSAQELVKREKDVPVDPKSPGEIALYLTALGIHDNFRPEGWQEKCLAWQKHESPFIVELTIKNMPKEINETIKNSILNNLQSEDIDVLIAACQKVVDNEMKEAKEQILNILKTTHDRWLINCAVNASYKLDSKWETLQILVSRLDESDKYGELIDPIRRFVIKDESGSSGGTTSSEDTFLKERWMKFLEKHDERIKAGNLFSFQDKEITPDLFPGYHWFLKDGTSWPPPEELK